MTIGFDGYHTVNGSSSLSYLDRLIIASLGQEYPRDTFMVYSPNSSDDRGMSWLLSIANVHNKTPYKAWNKRRWRNRGGIYRDWHRHGVKVFHGLDAILPTAKCKEKTKMVITVRDTTFSRYSENYSWLERLNRRSRVRKACRKAHRIIATSNYVKDELVSRLGADAAKIDVVHTAVRDEYATAVQDKVFLGNIKGKYHLPSRYILAISDFSPLGNIETLLRAFAALPDRDIDLVLLGQKNGYYTKKIKPLAAKLDIEDRVIRVSKVNKHQFMGLYAMAQAFVDPSLHDGVGQCIVESMATATPVIASDSGCHREIAADAALYFEPRDTAALAAHLKAVLTDEARRDAMTAAGAKLAERFTQKIMAEQTMDCYLRARGKI